MIRSSGTPVYGSLWRMGPIPRQQYRDRSAAASVTVYWDNNGGFYVPQAEPLCGCFVTLGDKVCGIAAALLYGWSEGLRRLVVG